MAYHSSLAILVLLQLIPSPASAEPELIHCPAEPPVVRQLDLQERWRIDSEDPDAPLLGFFGESQVLAHAGRVYLLDQQLSHVLVYSDDGDHLATFLREGEGPGEVRRPGAMFLCADGRLAVQHGYPPKLEIVDLDGTPHRRWQLRANASVRRFQETPLGWFGVYTEAHESATPGEFVTVLRAALHDDDGLRVAEFHREERGQRPGQTERIDEVDEHSPWHTAVAVDAGEVVLAAARDEYRLEWRNLAGETRRVVTREYPAHRRTPDELAELEYSSYSLFNGEIRFPDRRLSDHDPVIRSLDLLADGSLRVRTSLFAKGLPPGMVCRFEVHEPTGELRERVEIHDPSGAYDVNYDAIALLDDGRALVLRNLRPASRAAIDPYLHPELRKKLPPPPSARDDIAFTPIMCDLVSRDQPGGARAGDRR